MAKTPTGLTAADLFERNRQWAAAMVEQDPGFFKDLASQQAAASGRRSGTPPPEM